MTIIRWLSETIGEVGDWFLPVRGEFAPAYREPRIDGCARQTFYVAVAGCIMIGLSLPRTALAEDQLSGIPVNPRMVVAAGVGYENAETSTITVKIYDAEYGAILSEETYELNVRDDAASAGSQPRERIFAGGVGPGGDGLSAFTLRVYDATTGQFLWEGLLNLNGDNQESNSTHRIVAHLVTPQATVTRVHSRGAVDGQPHFFLRAVDSTTGQLVWTDHFLAGTGRLARTEPVSRAIVGRTEELAGPSHQIEFRIRMGDDQDRKILWEDTIEPTLEEAGEVVGHDATAENLPAWRGAGPEEMKKDVI